MKHITGRAALVFALAAGFGLPAAGPAAARPGSSASAQVQTAPTYDISPSAGPIGSALHVTGTGCPTRDGIDLTFSVINGPGRSQNFESEVDGSFSFDYMVPPARAGEQSDDNTYDTSLHCISSAMDVSGPRFTITGPVYTVDPESAAPGSSVTVSGVGCYDDAAVTDGTFVFTDGRPPVDFDSGDGYRFSFPVVVPDLPPGDYFTQITCLSQALQSPSGIGGVRLSGTAPFTVAMPELTRPAAPTALMAAAAPSPNVGSGQVGLSWNAPADGGSPITDYVVQRSVEGNTWSVVNDGVSTARTVVVSGLANGTTYRFRVAARNAVGVGPWSTTIRATPRWKPSAPTGLKAAVAPAPGVGSGQVRLTWNAPTSNGGSPIDDYVIHRSPDGSTWSVVNDGVSTARTVIVSRLANGTTYRFRVAAKNAVGVGPWSTTIRATPRWKPSAPAGLKAAVAPAPGVGSGQVRLTWDTPRSNGGARITDYVIQRSVNGRTWSVVRDGVSTVRAVVLSRLANGTTYRFRVAAENAVGRGPWSRTVQATPRAR